MPKETKYLQVKISPRLKEQFEAMCKEDEISMSDKVREIIANLVRNRGRKSSKNVLDEDN